jgi:AsmA protein
MKLAIKIIAALLLLIILAVIALVVLVDPNQFKPEIEKVAKEKGIALQMKGDIGWSFWPRLGVKLEDIALASLAKSDKPLAQLQQASLAVAVLPLLSGKLQAHQILLDDAKITLEVDENGKGNWESLTKKSNEAATVNEQKESAAASDLDLNIDSIRIGNAALSYLDLTTGQDIQLSDLNLELNDVNTQGKPFLMSLSWLLQMAQEKSAEKLKIKGQLNHKISVDKAITELQLDEGKLTLELNDKASLDLNYSLSAKDLQNNLSYQGKLEITPTNIRQLLSALGVQLETANSDALKEFSLSANLAGDKQQVALSDLKVALDKTTFTGNLAVTDLTKSAIKLALAGDKINVDDYLPPPAPEAKQKETTTELAEDTPLPLESLRGLNLDAQFNLVSMIINKMTVSDIDLDVKAKDGVINQNLSAKAYQGDIKFAANLDARNEKANLNFDSTVKQLELAPLLKEMEMNEKLDLSGAINVQAQGNSQGATVNQLFDGMNSTANFSGAQVRFAPLNIEEQFCKMVNLFSKENQQTDAEVAEGVKEVVWDAFTEMRALEGNMVWRDQVIQLEKFNAGVSQLLLASTGAINLASNTYEFKLPIKLSEASQAASLKGCTLSSPNFWVDRGLSLLRCKGAFGAINPLNDCGFDKGAVKDLVKDFAEYKLREKHGAKLEAAEKKIDEKKQQVKDEVKEKVEEKKKDFFNKLQNKLLKKEEEPKEEIKSE